jgi:ParB-like nuclease domain
MAKPPEQRLVPTADLRPYPGNPRRGDLEAIKDSLERNGQYRPIVVNRRTMEVLAGNHTLIDGTGMVVSVRGTRRRAYWRMWSSPREGQWLAQSGRRPRRWPKPPVRRFPAALLLA